MNLLLLGYTDDISQNTALFQIVTLDRLIYLELIMIIMQNESWDHHVSTTSPSMWSDIICKQCVYEHTCIIFITTHSKAMYALYLCIVLKAQWDYMLIKPTIIK